MITQKKGIINEFQMQYKSNLQGNKFSVKLEALPSRGIWVLWGECRNQDIYNNEGNFPDTEEALA